MEVFLVIFDLVFPVCFSFVALRREYQWAMQQPLEDPEKAMKEMIADESPENSASSSGSSSNSS